MRLLILAVLPLLGAIGVGLVQRSRRGVGSAWLISVITVLIGWGLSLMSTWQAAYSQITIPWLLPSSSFRSIIAFSSDSNRWVYILLAFTLGTTVLLTAPSRLALQSGPKNWIANLINIAVLIPALSAEDVTAIALSWTLLDSVAILTEHLLIGVPPRKSMINLLGRWLSTLLIIGVALSQTPPGSQLDPRSWSQLSGMLFFLGIALRVGLIPLGAGISFSTQANRGVWTVLNYQNPLLGLALLTRFAGPELSASFGLSALPLLLSLWGVVNALLWGNSPEASQGFPHWIAAMSSLALTSAYTANASPLPWALLIVLMGTCPLLAMFVLPPRQVFLFINLLTFSTLPLTPLAGGWQGLMTTLGGWIWPLTVAISITGWYHHMDNAKSSLVTSERWIVAVYGLGLLLLPLTAWGLWGLKPTLYTQAWLAGSITFLLTLAGVLGLHHRIIPLSSARPFFVWLGQRINQTQHSFVQFFSLIWLINGFTLLHKGLKPLAHFLEGVLEGESGLLWALVLLALLLSLANASGISP
ncbi:hypothetical protein QYE77_14235 [Thermanaerothrix sp. 4228-RoL]|uniref:NADH:quinone oxidoreductase/Mrp antiporter membrane subunit domain-containing protein n=1 Tax=Thermanaerothrix solaris TaxID=3058434 RepID=A0ABU3NRG6_9CHLR|nr:hypothetical protein [Thermanaerothrix sp. 4228-RoL]MDT8899420.1 hypothetical protein [Thermanaerothrix sp. 4228-RoL]